MWLYFLFKIYILCIIIVIDMTYLVYRWLNIFSRIFILFTNNSLFLPSIFDPFKKNRLFTGETTYLPRILHFENPSLLHTFQSGFVVSVTWFRLHIWKVLRPSVMTFVSRNLTFGPRRPPSKKRQGGGEVSCLPYGHTRPVTDTTRPVCHHESTKSSVCR